MIKNVFFQSQNVLKRLSNLTAILRQQVIVTFYRIIMEAERLNVLLKVTSGLCSNCRILASFIFLHYFNVFILEKLVL